MPSPLKRFISIEQQPESVALFKETLHQWKRIPSNMLAGGLAYFALFSATSLLVFLVGLLGQMIAKAQVVAQLDVVLSPRIGRLVREWLLPTNDVALSTLPFLGLLMLLFGASQIFIQLKTSLNLNWGTPLKDHRGWRGFVGKTLQLMLMILGSGVLILSFVLLDAGIGLASRIFGTLMPGLGHVALWEVANLISSWVLFALFFAGIFRWVPSQRLPWRSLWPGAMLTSALVASGKIALAFYFSWLSFDSLYGAVGSLIVIMVWVYVSSQLTLTLPISFKPHFISGKEKGRFLDGNDPLGQPDSTLLSRRKVQTSALYGVANGTSRHYNSAGSRTPLGTRSAFLLSDF